MADFENVTSYQPHWEDDDLLGPDSWDTCFLDGERLAGRCTVTCPLSRDVDAKKAKGKCGGTITDNGENITPVTITQHIATPEEWELFQKQLPKFWARKKGGKRSPMKIEHPKTAICGIAEIYLKEIDIGDPGLDGLTVKYTAEEWLIAPKDAPKPKKSSAAAFPPGQVREYSIFSNPSDKQPANVDDIIAGTAKPGSANPWA